ncbi:MAG TPA: hypothetical protein IAB02_00035 [Candidatus Pullichristensenella excrementigallinarum]|uniref:DUF1980 domain-containing protein n=1 Tax=Candidatus Pullichristensenella excrementigallinarum TaxID=2840907 RepID=A0A9D1I9N8_9FIRM|nr:hypothetical protein [Candidatus Pullichristensenella excrementigallinarum]
MRILLFFLSAILLFSGGLAESVPEEVMTIPEDRFAATILEIGSNFSEYEGKTLRLTGYVAPLLGEEGAQFCVMRDYNCCGGTDLRPYGFDCFWEGDLPEIDSWVTVTGVIGQHERSSGYSYLLLTLTDLEPAQEGSRVVYG